MFISLTYYKLPRILLFGWLIYRVGSISWRRHKVTKCLTKKRASLLDKHSRLHTKFQGLDSNNTKWDQEQLTELPVAQLRLRLRKGRLQAIDLLDAFQIRALELFRSHSNCISELIFEADVYAFLVDPVLQDPNASLTPIHGIPIALDELFPVRGYDHTMGYVTCANIPAEQDCTLVEVLKECGAIPFVLTNPKRKITGLAADNPIFGLTKHPTHEGRCCVSGSAVCLAQNGAPLAIGTDLLGEARLSAAFCGKVGFKPTNRRMTQMRMCLPIGLPERLGPVASPMGNYANDVTDVLRSLWTSTLFQFDRSLYPALFDEKKFSQSAEFHKLKIGYFADFDNLLPATSACQRILEETVNYLKGQGHELVPFQIPNANQAFETTMGLLAVCMEPEILRLVYGRGYGDVYRDVRQRLMHVVYALPRFLRKQLNDIFFSDLDGKYPIHALALKGLSSDLTYSELLCKSNELTTEFFRTWNDSELDLLICPVAPIPAPQNYGSSQSVYCALLYTSLFNLFGCPAGTIPVGQVRKEDIKSNETQQNSHDSQLDQTMKAFKKDYEGSEGLSLGIQIVGKPWDDELVLGMMKYLESMPESY